MKTGQNQTQISQQLQVHKCTISRELARNRGLRDYRPKQAHQMAVFRRQNKATHPIDLATWSLIEQQLRNEWSPEQIRGWLKGLKARRVSHECIYQHILKDKRQGGNLYRYLRCQKKRKKRYGTYSRQGQIPNRVSIDQRPAIVDSKSRLGDWEVDTIIGKGHRQALVSLTERKSRLLRLAKVTFKSAECVTQAVIGLLKPLADRVHTLTSDNGREFAQHQKISTALNTQFYFAHPYASWQRGLTLCVNMNETPPLC
jgi:IS30 family transposase